MLWFSIIIILYETPPRTTYCKTICAWYNKFDKADCLLAGKQTGRPSVSAENVFSLIHDLAELWTIIDRLFGIVVSTSDCYPRDPGFDSQLYPRNFFGSIGSVMGSTQPHENIWVLLDMRSSVIRLRKLKLNWRDKRFANHKAPCTAIWQQPLQSVLALRGCSVMDFSERQSCIYHRPSDAGTYYIVEIEYRIAVCSIINGGHIEHL